MLNLLCFLSEIIYCRLLLHKCFFLSQASQLEKEQEALQAKQWELEKIQEERRAAEERRKKSELGSGKLFQQISNRKCSNCSF